MFESKIKRKNHGIAVCVLPITGIVLFSRKGRIVDGECIQRNFGDRKPGERHAKDGRDWNTVRTTLR